MTLHYQQKSKYPQSGRPDLQIVLIHGWAMNSAVWDELMDELAFSLPVVALDLPGYGQSAMLDKEYNLKNLAQAVEPVLTLAKRSIVLGWSLGGLVAMELATHFPKKIQQLILVGSSPRFVQAEDWPYAVEKEIFHQFANSLKQDINKTINRFMVLQMLGSASAKEDARKVSQRIKSQGEPVPEALDKGLDILLNEDRRQQLNDLHLPISLICGSRDTLVKKAALDELAKQKNIDLYVLSEAGHVPFVSHYEEFYALLEKALAVNEVVSD